MIDMNHSNWTRPLQYIKKNLNIKYYPLLSVFKSNTIYKFYYLSLNFNDN